MIKIAEVENKVNFVHLSISITLTYILCACPSNYNYNLAFFLFFLQPTRELQPGPYISNVQNLNGECKMECEMHL